MWRHFKDIQSNLLTKPPFPFRSASVSTRMSRKPSVFATRSRESFPTPMLDKVGEFTLINWQYSVRTQLGKAKSKQLNIKCLSLRSSARFPIGRRMLLWPERLWWRESRWHLTSFFKIISWMGVLWYLDGSSLFQGKDALLCLLTDKVDKAVIEEGDKLKVGNFLRYSDSWLLNRKTGF